MPTFHAADGSHPSHSLYFYLKVALACTMANRTVRSTSRSVRRRLLSYFFLQRSYDLCILCTCLFVERTFFHFPYCLDGFVFCQALFTRDCDLGSMCDVLRDLPEQCL